MLLHAAGTGYESVEIATVRTAPVAGGAGIRQLVDWIRGVGDFQDWLAAAPSPSMLQGAYVPTASGRHEIG